MNQNLVKTLFDYKDGALYWKIFTNSRAPVGSKAGTFNKHNQRWYIRVNKIRYLEHRLIFLLHYGWLPKEIDHKDNNRLNNRIENLRAATSSQNQQNKPLQCNNTSRAKNVRYKAKKWQVELKIKGKPIYIGRFDNFELADLVAIEARNKYHKEFANHV
jgi:lysozyme family protein